MRAQPCAALTFAARGPNNRHGRLYRSVRRGPRRLPRRLRTGTARGVPRHRRGRGELQLRAAHRRGRFHPHAVRKAGGPGGPAVFPGADGASRAAAGCPAPGRSRGGTASRCGACAAGSRQSPPSCPASGRAARSPGTAPRWARRWRGCIRPARTIRPRRTTRSARPGGRRCWSVRSPATTRPRPWRRARRGAAGRARAHPGRLARRAAGRGISTPTCSPTTCSSSTAGVSGLIDFYFAATDLLAYDVAVCLNAWCFEPDLSCNVTKARALLRGYAGLRPLAAEELAALPVLAAGAALRFAADPPL